MRRFIRLIACLFLTASTLTFLEATAAALVDATPPATAAARSVAAVEPVSSAEILMQADADERFVEEKITLARQPDPSAKLVTRFDALAAGVHKLSEKFKQEELRALPAIRLESLERHWEFYNTQLAEWRGQLQRITAVYSEAAADLAKRRAAWEVTRNAAGDLAPALASRVDAVLAEITLAEKALSVPLEDS